MGAACSPESASLALAATWSLALVCRPRAPTALPANYCPTGSSSAIPCDEGYCCPSPAPNAIPCPGRPICSVSVQWARSVQRRAHQATTASATATPPRLGLCIRYCVRSATAIANTTRRASATLLTMHACSARLARLATTPCGRPASTVSPDMSVRRVLPLVTLDVNLWLL